jgi:hypothetical protein
MIAGQPTSQNREKYPPCSPSLQLGLTWQQERRERERERDTHTHTHTHTSMLHLSSSQNTQQLGQGVGSSFDL